jgi:hypothetical protein
MHVPRTSIMTTKEPSRLFPYMAGVITANDVRQKGTGKFAADFVSWAKVMQLINQHHNGWQPQLAINPDGGHVFKAPDGSAYIIVSFIHPEGGESTEWPYAVTNNSNHPIPFDSVTCADLSKAHRRAICSAAAAFFSLGYELWAREEYAQAEDQVAPPVPLQQDVQVKPTAAKKKPAKADPEPAEQQNRQQLQDTLTDIMYTLEKGKVTSFLNEKTELWGLKDYGSKIAQMNEDQLKVCIDELN